MTDSLKPPFVSSLESDLYTHTSNLLQGGGGGRIRGGGRGSESGSERWSRESDMYNVAGFNQRGGGGTEEVGGGGAGRGNSRSGGTGRAEDRESEMYMHDNNMHDSRLHPHTSAHKRALSNYNHELKDSSASSASSYYSDNRNLCNSQYPPRRTTSPTPSDLSGECFVHLSLHE